MNLRVLIFPVLGLLFLFSTHYFLFFSTVKFFSVEKQYIKWILMLIFGFLSVSFFLSAVLIRYSDFILFKLLYFLAAFWIGLAINLLLASIIVWLIILLSGTQGYDIKYIIGPLAFFAALLFSIYGVYNGFNPEIKNIDIEIENIGNWKGKKIIQLSDLHLGRIHGVGFLEKIVNKVNDEKPDLVVITGDLFDGMGSSPEKFIRLLNKLEAANGIYFITGNHEAYLGVEGVLKKLENSDLEILDNRMVEIAGLQLIGVSYPEFGSLEKKDVSIALDNYDKNKPSILLYHPPASIENGNITGAEQRSEIYWSPNLDFSKVKDLGIDLQLSGHTHKGQIFPFNLVTKLIYDGYDYGLVREGNFQIYTTSGAGTWGPPMRTGNKGEITSIRLK